MAGWICECGFRNEISFKCKQCNKSLIQGKLKSAWLYGFLALTFPIMGFTLTALFDNPILLFVLIAGFPFLIKCMKLNDEWKAEHEIE